MYLCILCCVSCLPSTHTSIHKEIHNFGARPHCCGEGRRPKARCSGEDPHGLKLEVSQGSKPEQKQKKLHKQNKARGKQRTLAKELEWIQMGTKKRSLRNSVLTLSDEYEELTQSESSLRASIEGCSKKEEELDEQVIRYSTELKKTKEQMNFGQLDFEVGSWFPTNLKINTSFFLTDR